MSQFLVCAIAPAFLASLFTHILLRVLPSPHSDGVSDFFLSDKFPFPDMPFDQHVFEISPLPQHPKDWNEFLLEFRAQSARTFTEKFTPQGEHTQRSNYEAIFLMGLYSDKFELWKPGDQNLDKLKINTFQHLCTEIPADDKKFLESEFLKYPFKNRDFHLQMQIQVHQAITVAVSSHPKIARAFRTKQDQVKNPSDLYQGSRAIAHFIQVASEFLETNRHVYHVELQRAIKTVAKTEDLTAANYHDFLKLTGQYIDLLTLSGMKDAEAEVLKFLKRTIQHNKQPSIVRAVTAGDPTTLVALLENAVKELPPEEADEDGADVFLSFVKPQPSIMARAFNAVASTLTGSEPSGAAAMLSDADAELRRKRDEKTQRHIQSLKRRNEHLLGVARSHGVSEDELRLPPYNPHDGKEETGTGKRAWPRRGGAARGGHSRGGGTFSGQHHGGGSSAGARDSSGLPDANQVICAFLMETGDSSQPPGDNDSENGPAELVSSDEDPDDESHPAPEVAPVVTTSPMLSEPDIHTSPAPRSCSDPPVLPPSSVPTPSPVEEELAADPVVEPPVFSPPVGSHPSQNPRVRKPSGLGSLLVFLWISAGLIGFFLLDPDGAFSAWQSLSRVSPAAMRAMLTTSCVGLSAHALAIQQRIQYNWKTLVMPLFLIFLPLQPAQSF